MILINENNNWEPFIHHRLVYYANHYRYMRFRDMVLDICQKYYGQSEIILGKKGNSRDILYYIELKLRKMFKIHGNITLNQRKQIEYGLKWPSMYIVPFSFDDFNYKSFPLDKMITLIGKIIRNEGKRLYNIKDNKSYSSVNRIKTDSYTIVRRP